MSGRWGYGPYGFNPYGNNQTTRPFIRQIVGTQTLESNTGGRRYTVTYYSDGSKEVKQNYATPWGYNS